MAVVERVAGDEREAQVGIEDHDRGVGQLAQGRDRSGGVRANCSRHLILGRTHAKVVGRLSQSSRFWAFSCVYQ